MNTNEIGYKLATDTSRGYESVFIDEERLQQDGMKVHVISDHKNKELLPYNQVENCTLMAKAPLEMVIGQRVLTCRHVMMIAKKRLINTMCVIKNFVEIDSRDIAPDSPPLELWIKELFLEYTVNVGRALIYANRHTSDRLLEEMFKRPREGFTLVDGRVIAKDEFAALKIMVTVMNSYKSTGEDRLLSGHTVNEFLHHCSKMGRTPSADAKQHAVITYFGPDFCTTDFQKHRTCRLMQML